MDSRLRGNDINSVCTVIPAKAGMIVRTAQPGTPPAVIPAKAGIHAAYPNTNAVPHRSAEHHVGTDGTTFAMPSPGAAAGASR